MQDRQRILIWTFALLFSQKCFSHDDAQTIKIFACGRFDAYIVVMEFSRQVLGLETHFSKFRFGFKLQVSVLQNYSFEI